MDDDFNTADALAAVFDLIKFSNTALDGGCSPATAEALLAQLETLCGVLGLKTEKKEELLDEQIEALIAARTAARKAKDFAKADEIRGQLLDMGIVLKDTREGVKWERV